MNPSRANSGHFRPARWAIKAKNIAFRGLHPAATLAYLGALYGWGGMLRRSWIVEFAVAAVICILALLLAPASAGPYSATHGPVTVLRARRDGILLQFRIALAALFCAMRIAPALVAALQMRESSQHSRQREFTTWLLC